MQIAIYLTVKQAGIVKIERASELAGIPLEELSNPSATAGLHVGFENFSWQLERLGGSHVAGARLWLTESAHAVLRQILDSSFCCNVLEMGGDRFYGVDQNWTSRIAEAFRPRTTQGGNQHPNVVEDRPHPIETEVKQPTAPTPLITSRVPLFEESGMFDFLREAPVPLLETPVRCVGFSNRVKGVFAARGIEKVGDLLGRHALDMLEWENFGQTSLLNVQETLGSLMRGKAGDGSDFERSITGAYPNWIDAVEGEHPDLSQILLNAAIRTDEDYVAKEAFIQLFQARIRLAEIRFGFLTAGKDVSEDPGLVAQACPEWVRSRDIESLMIPNACLKKLLDNGVRMVGDLVNLRPEAMLSWPAFGRSSLRDVCEWLTRAIQDGPTDMEALVSRYAGSAVRNWITECYEEMTALAPAVLSVRAVEALNGRSSGMTLQQIGDAMIPSCSRERVRQLETTALAAFKKRAFWSPLLALRLEKIFEATNEPVAVPALPGMDAAFENTASLGERFYWVLEQVLPSPFFSISCADFQSEILARISLKDWKTAVHCGRDVLRKAVFTKEERTESDLSSAVIALLPDEARELRQHLWREVSRRAVFVERDGMRRLSDYGGGNEIVELLESSESPLHWTEIVESVKNMPRASIRNRLLELENVFRFGPGTYGVQRHFRMSAEDMKMIAAECRAIAQGGEDRQWSCAEFSEELHKADFHLEGRVEPLSPDMLNNALRISGADLGFVSVGRLNWKLKGEGGSGARLQILPECLEILKQHGRPMPVGELRRRLMQSRGLGAFLQFTTFHKEGLTLIRMDSQNIGILELHAGPLAEAPRRDQLVQAVYAMLLSQQRGLHISELVSVQDAADLIREAGLDPILLIDVCRLHQKIRFSRGACLYLAEWEEDRRRTLAQAINEAFEGDSIGLTSRQLLEKITAILGRVVSWSEVLSGIYKTNVRRDEANATWILKRWTEET